MGDAWGGECAKQSSTRVEGGRFLIVHNGIVKNHERFVAQLQRAGIQMESETDSESIIKMIGWECERLQGCNVAECIRDVLGRIEGGFAVVIQDRATPNRLYCCRRDLPLLIGRRGDGTFVVSSEMAGLEGCIEILEGHDDRLIVLRQEEGFQLQERDGNFLEPEETRDEATRKTTTTRSWTEKEILEQPDMVEQILARRLDDDGRVHWEEWGEDETVVRGAMRLPEMRHVRLMGCGTSYHAAKAACMWFQEDRGRWETVQAHDAVDFDIRDAPRDLERTLWILISQSGETMDLLVLLQKLPADAIVIGILNVRNSMMWRRCPFNLCTMAGRERGVASTKSFTCQVLHLLLLSRWMGDHPMKRESVRKIPGIMRQTFKLFPALEKWCGMLSRFSSLLILGRGDGYIAAIESALKMKELSRIHTEAFSSGSLKHGPLRCWTRACRCSICTRRIIRPKRQSSHCTRSWRDDHRFSSCSPRILCPICLIIQICRGLRYHVPTWRPSCRRS